MLRLLTVLCLSFCMNGAALADGHLPEEKIAASAAMWSKLYAEKDLDGLMTLYHKDASLFAHNQPGRFGRAAIRDFFGDSFKGMKKGAQIDFSIEKIAVFGDTANLVSLYKMDINTGKKKPVTIVGRSMLMYKRDAFGHWLLYSDMDNLAPDATEETFKALKAAK